MTAPRIAGRTPGRWWLWLPLLAVGAWLAVFGDKTPAGGEAALSLPTRGSTPASNSASTSAPSPAPAAAPATAAARSGSGTGEPPQPLMALLPREQLIAAQPQPGARDLFASRNWNPPPPPAPVVVAAPVAPPLPFVFLGKKLEGDSWEVYLARGEQTFIVREGTNLDGSYRVDKIAPPTLSLTYIPLGQAQMLSIGETR